jgi:hypothetical protein
MNPLDRVPAEALKVLAFLRDQGAGESRYVDLPASEVGPRSGRRRLLSALVGSGMITLPCGWPGKASLEPCGLAALQDH